MTIDSADKKCLSFIRNNCLSVCHACLSVCLSVCRFVRDKSAENVRIASSCVSMHTHKIAGFGVVWGCFDSAVVVKRKPGHVHARGVCGLKCMNLSYFFSDVLRGVLAVSKIERCFKAVFKYLFRPSWIEKCYRFCTPDCFYFSKKIEWLSLQILFTPLLILMGTGILAQAYTLETQIRELSDLASKEHMRKIQTEKKMRFYLYLYLCWGQINVSLLYFWQRYISTAWNGCLRK